MGGDRSTVVGYRADVDDGPEPAPDLVDVEVAARIAGIDVGDVPRELGPPAQIDQAGGAWWERGVCEAAGLSDTGWETPRATG